MQNRLIEKKDVFLEMIEADPSSPEAPSRQALPRQKLQIPFRHKRKYYREAIDCFCLRKSRRQKVRVCLCVSSEQSERAANGKV